MPVGARLLRDCGAGGLILLKWAFALVNATPSS